MGEGSEFAFLFPKEKKTAYLQQLCHVSSITAKKRAFLYHFAFSHEKKRDNLVKVL